MADLKIEDFPVDVGTLADDDKFAVVDASDLTADAFITAAGIKAYVLADTSIRRVPTGGFVLTSTTAQQALFPSPNALTLSTGVYEFKVLLTVTGMSATSGNMGFSILGAGTAILASNIMATLGADSAGAVANQTGHWVQSSATGAAIVSAATGTQLWAQIRGTFEVTTGGTIIPSVNLLTAAAATVQQGSLITVTKLGDTGLTSAGAWA